MPAIIFPWSDYSFKVSRAAAEIWAAAEASLSLRAFRSERHSRTIIAVTGAAILPCVELPAFSSAGVCGAKDRKVMAIGRLGVSEAS